MDKAVSEEELPADVIAKHMGLPPRMLTRRIEAGDIPARSEITDEGTRYYVKLADLGISEGSISAIMANHQVQREPEVTSVSGADPQDQEMVELTGHTAKPVAQMVEVTQQAVQAAGAAVHTSPPVTQSPTVSEDPSKREQEDTQEPVAPNASSPIEKAVPPPGRAAELTLFDYPYLSSVDPRAELASMSLDPRELVAGLLDRWERTLEQRIYAEQRQRFEAELNNRQSQVRQLQSELQTVRAEHAAAQADKNRAIAEKERELARGERELSELRKKRSGFRKWFGSGK